MLSRSSRVTVILSLRRIRNSDADHEKRILRSYLPQDDTSPAHENVASRPVQGFHGRWRVLGPMDSSGWHHLADEETGARGQRDGLLDVDHARPVGIQADAYLGATGQGQLPFHVERQRARARLADVDG